MCRVFFIMMFHCLLGVYSLCAQVAISVTVAKDGSGNFKSIQEAVNSLSDSSAQNRIIFIKNGEYKERLYIAKHRIVLRGEDRDKTIITGAIASLIYACENPNDRYSGVVNLDGNDITLTNLTIENTYGLNAPDSIFFDCVNEEMGKVERIKVIKTAHQFALLSIKATRLKVINCILRNWGNDTVSPWNGETGMYYFKDCIMMGGTDFYCPRGSAYAEHCTFITNVSSAAAIWHDGSKDRNFKSVFTNCNFKSDSPFILGRYHHEANFYLINCAFDKNLRDLPIFKAATAKPMFWNSHAYYYHCKTEGKKFDWLKDNLETAPGSPSAETITAQWTFDGKWDPVK
jgi:pectinesterase